MDTPALAGKQACRSAAVAPTTGTAPPPTKQLDCIAISWQSQQVAQNALVMMCAWWGGQTQAWGDWRYATMDCGLLCVVLTHMLLLLLAGNLDIHNMHVSSSATSLLAMMIVNHHSYVLSHSASEVWIKPIIYQFFELLLHKHTLVPMHLQWQHILYNLILTITTNMFKCYSVLQ